LRLHQISLKTTDCGLKASYVGICTPSDLFRLSFGRFSNLLKLLLVTAVLCDLLRPQLSNLLLVVVLFGRILRLKLGDMFPLIVLFGC
jgi:hypothetical protein